MDSCLAARSTASSFGFDGFRLRGAAGLDTPSALSHGRAGADDQFSLPRGSNQTGTALWTVQTWISSPSMLAPEAGLSVGPEGPRHRQSRTGGLAFSGAWPCAFKLRDSFGGPLSDVPPGCPKGKPSDHHCFAETRKGVPTNEGRHAR